MDKLLSMGVDSIVMHNVDNAGQTRLRPVAWDGSLIRTFPLNDCS